MFTIGIFAYNAGAPLVPSSFSLLVNLTSIALSSTSIYFLITSICFDKLKTFSSLPAFSKPSFSSISSFSAFLSKVSIWVVLYGVISIIISFPLIAGTLWLGFANMLITALQGAFSNLSQDNFIYKVVVFLIIFSFPLIINIITWTVQINCIKTKENNKVFCGFWIIQGLMSLGMIIYMCFQLYGA